jgi:ribonuclease HI
MTVSSVEIFCDGASRGNPGQASAGAVLFGEGGRVLAEISERLGIATNNEAEYVALILALKKAREMGASTVAVNADSQLVIRQLIGQYKVKHPEMKRRHAEAMGLLSGFSGWSAKHVPREQNEHADKLANAALDAKS